MKLFSNALGSDIRYAIITTDDNSRMIVGYKGNIENIIDRNVVTDVQNVDESTFRQYVPDTDAADKLINENGFIFKGIAPLNQSFMPGGLFGNALFSTTKHWWENNWTNERKNGDKTQHISVSGGNSKMGQVESLSLPALETCDVENIACPKICYAVKLMARYKSVKDAYWRNLNLYEDESTRERFWQELGMYFKRSVIFRMHVSGDIPDDDYFKSFVELAAQYPNCNVLIFTKKYDIVNRYVKQYGELPPNVKMVFSEDEKKPMDNPNNFPEAVIEYKRGRGKKAYYESNARENAFRCHGNCEKCWDDNTGCWYMKKGDQVIFRQH